MADPVRGWTFDKGSLSIATGDFPKNEVYTITNRTSDFVRILKDVPVIAEVRELPDTKKVVHIVNDSEMQKFFFQFHRYGPKPPEGYSSTLKCPYQGGENITRFVSLLGNSNLLTTYEGESEKYRNELIALFAKQAKTLPLKWETIATSWIESQKAADSSQLFDTVHELIGGCLIKGLLGYDECTKEEIAINTSFWKNLLAETPGNLEGSSWQSISNGLHTVGKIYTYYWKGSQWEALVKRVVEKTGNKPGTICHTLRKDGLSEIEMTENIRGLLLAGQETVGYLLGFLLYEYARNPKIQGQHQEALHSNLEVGRALLKDAFLEALRMYPVGGAIRIAGHDLLFTYSSETHSIKKGDTISIYPWTINKDPTLFGENTDKFNPVRKGLDQVKTRLSPFGSGPHRCPGEKIAQAEILFLVEKILLATTILTSETIEETIGGFTLRPIKDITVTFL